MLKSHVINGRFEKLHVETGKHGGRDEGHFGVCQARQKLEPDGIENVSRKLSVHVLHANAISRAL